METRNTNIKQTTVKKQILGHCSNKCCVKIEEKKLKLLQAKTDALGLQNIKNKIILSLTCFVKLQPCFTYKSGGK